jgi:DNA-binding NarL/FixJ family response regulator
MYARAAELAEVLDSVRRGTTVVVRGLPGAGRSELLRRATADLEATGIQAVTANGLYWDRARQRRAATQPANTDVDVVSFATSLAQELQGSVVLLVDDADELDDATMLLVDTLASRLRAPMIIAAPPLPRGARSSLPRAARQAVTVDVRPLLYPETTDYLRAHRGIHADARLATRIYTKSGGVPGLVDALVDTGTRAGLIAERDGTWSMTGTSLWNRHLEPYVMRLVGSLSPEEHDALQVLALAGALPLGPALELVGPDLVTSLSERELLTVLGDTRSGALISVTPPLVADHVRRSSVSPARLVLEDRVRAVLGDETSGADDPGGQGVASLGTPADAALGRYFADREASDRRVRWRLWDDAPSVPAALRYLAVAMTASGPPQGVDELLVRTPVTDADSAADVLGLAAYAVLHRDLHHGDASAVLGVLDEAARRFPQLDEALTWQQHLSDMLRGGVELAAPSAEDASSTESIGRNAVAAVQALADALGGRGLDAADRLAEMTAHPSPIVAYVESMAHGLALLAEGRGDELVDTALRSLDAARVVLDRSALFLHSYLATVALIRTGRWREARQILGGVLVLGSPPRFLAHSWAGMCRLSALLSLRSGDPAFSRSLLAGADAAVSGDGALPGAQRRLSDAIRALAEGDDAGAADEMREGAQECRGRGWFLAAVSLQTYAVCLDPTDRNVRELQTLRDHPAGRSTTQFADFVVAARSGADAAADAAAAYVPDSSTFFVILVLRTLTEHAEAASSTDARVLADAARALTERAGWERPAEYFDGRHALMVELTPREREIGLLAGVHSNGEIAELLHLSTRTVANHVSNALRKLGLSSRAELFEWLRSEAARAG